MSTRAMYTFTDQHDTIHVYKHFDGYPEGAAEFITAALALAWPLPRFEADDFAAAFVAANKDSGGNVRLCGTRIQQPWDMACDAEYWYQISYHGGPELTIIAYSVSWWDKDQRQQERIYQGPLSGLAQGCTVPEACTED